MNDNKEIIALGNIIKTNVLKYERLIILLVALGLTIKYLHVPLSGLINTILLSSIAVVYFFSAFSTQEETDLTGFDNFIYKLSGFGSAVLIIGMLFSIQNWPGYKNMLFMGLPTLLISLIYILIQKGKRPELKLFNKWFIIRIFLLIVFSSGLMIDKFS